MSVLSPSFRSRFRASIERPVAAIFIRTRLTPNALTLIGFAIAVIGAWLAATQSWLLAGLVVAFGAVFDLFDGALARATNSTSRFGAFMDSTFDRAGEAVVYIGIAVGLSSVDAATGPVVTMAAMGGAFMVSYIRAKSDSLGFSSGSGMASVGLAPREVRSVILVLGLIVAGTYGLSVLAASPAGIPAPPPMWWIVLVGALALIAILAIVTTIQRILFIYRQSKTQPK